ncbi:MAG: hypothetical protein OEU09_22995 [Rhodospirillales bacterium]|nr:hypothetical protein [Rhodospirillales bacterium]MDH3792752.1 hypothetical protein [Rhodospirillales bacterium]MDH3914155.1 hypothetical protein [Rhodospirillales bacterium]
MTRPRPTYCPDPRIWNDYQVASRLGRSQGWLSKNRARLEAEGFPARDEWLDGTDAEAVEQWLDMRAGLVPENEDAALARRLERMGTNG